MAARARLRRRAREQTTPRPVYGDGRLLQLERERAERAAGECTDTPPCLEARQDGPNRWAVFHVGAWPCPHEHCDDGPLLGVADLTGEWHPAFRPIEDVQLPDVMQPDDVPIVGLTGRVVASPSRRPPVAHYTVWQDGDEVVVDMTALGAGQLRLPASTKGRSGSQGLALGVEIVHAIDAQRGVTVAPSDALAKTLAPGDTLTFDGVTVTR
jgi:hypothetical protein